MMRNQPVQHGRRQAAARSHSGKDQSIDHAALVHRNPASHKLIRCRINHRLSSAQGKPQPDQQRHGMGDVRRQKCGQRCCHAPGQDSQGQDPAGSEACGQPSGRQLKSCITDQKGTEDPAQPLIP